MKLALAGAFSAALMISGVQAFADDSMSAMPGNQMMMKQCMTDQKAMNNGMSMSDMKKTCSDKMSEMKKQCMSDQKSMNSGMSMSDMKKACDDKMMNMKH